jgi:sialate O-acetylesterase
MVVTTDLADDLHNIHPIRKREVGERLALWALAKNYGKTNLVFSGPLFQSLEIKGNRAVVHFDYAQGLKTSDGKTPIDFEIAGADGNFAPADAMIEGNTIVLKAASVEVPSAVRFGWNEAAHPNLVNGAGLPASPFASDK